MCFTESISLWQNPQRFDDLIPILSSFSSVIKSGVQCSALNIFEIRIFVSHVMFCKRPSETDSFYCNVEVFFPFQEMLSRKC